MKRMEMDEEITPPIIKRVKPDPYTNNNSDKISDMLTEVQFFIY